MRAFKDWLRELDDARAADRAARDRVVAVARLFVEQGPSWGVDLADAVREQKAAADRYYSAAKAKVDHAEAA